MAETTNLSKLIINYLTEEQYQTAKASDLINENELYIESAQRLLGVAHPAVARFVVGTSTAGWTDADCDYLCDGTADQTEINAAITALPATGGEIVILDGTYNITAKINVTKDNVSIRGNGNATILMRGFDSSVAEGVITLTGRSGCKIANLQIEGNITSYIGSNNSGIYLSSASNNTITGNTCNNNNSGIRLVSSSDNTVTGNTCNSNSSGIYLSSSSNNNTVTGNTCNNNSYGIYLDSSSNNTVTGNTCIRGTGLTTDYTVSQHTIQLNGTGNSYNLIAMNNCMGKAITVGGGAGNTLVNNKFDDSDDIQAFAGTLANTDWTGSAAPYTKAVTVVGILAAGKPPTVDVTLSETWATAMIEDEEWTKIKRVAYTNNTLTFYATEVPTVSLNFKGVQPK